MTLASPRLIRKRPFICVSFVGLASGDWQRSGSRDEQKRGNESTGEERGGFAGGSDHVEHWKNPFSIHRTHHWARASFNAGGVPNGKSRCFSVRRDFQRAR